MEKTIEPVFEVTVSVSMAEVSTDAAEVDVYEGDADVYISGDAIKRALIQTAAAKVVSLIDRNVLNGIQQLTQAEIKDQIAKKVPPLIDAAIAGPASQFPEMTIAELLEKEIEKQFETRAVGIFSDSKQSRIGSRIETVIDRHMKCFEATVNKMVSDIIVEKAKETASGLIDASKAA